MRAFLLCVFLLLAAPAFAQIEAGPSDDIEAILNALEPGDEVILADGMYIMDELFTFTADGTEAAPIVIRAADGASPHFHRPIRNQNLWDFYGQHLTIRGIRFSGGDAGLRVRGATDVTIEDCEIFDTGGPGLRMNDGGDVTYLRPRILRNHIHHTGGHGEGMYLGCNADDCRVADGLIEGNYVHHTNIDVSQGDGIELKEGSYGTTIRDNVVHDTQYPCILGYTTNGNGAPNVVEGNVVWNCQDHGIQWEADATIRNNIVLGAGGSALANQPHMSSGPSNLIIVHNTLINDDGDALAIRNPSGSVLVANNALYSMSGRSLFVLGDMARVMVISNAGDGRVEGHDATLIPSDISMDLSAADHSGSLPLLVFPRVDGALAGAGSTEHVPEFDFDGTPRAGVADIGAYALARGGPAWMIAEGFKERAMTPPPGDAGTTDAGTTDAGGSDAGGSDASTPDASSDAGTSDAGTSDAGTEPPSDDGGCAVHSGSGSSVPTWCALGILAMFIRRRRRP